MGRKGRELSQDNKKLFVDLYENSHKLSEISKLLSVPCMTISTMSFLFLDLSRVILTHNWLKMFVQGIFTMGTLNVNN